MFYLSCVCYARITDKLHAHLQTMTKNLQSLKYLSKGVGGVAQDYQCLLHALVEVEPKMTEFKLRII